MKTYRKLLNEKETTATEDYLIGCIDDLQKEIDELNVKINNLQREQQPIRAIGYHDIEKFYIEEK